MARGVKFRRGSTNDHTQFTGAEGEITIDTDKDVAVVHDGTTIGGKELVGVAATQRVTNKYVDAINVSVSGVSTFTGTVSFGSTITLGDNDFIILGDGSDLKIHHDGSNSFVQDVGTGTLNIQSDGTGVNIQKVGGNNLARFVTDGAAELYYNNAKEFETTGYGATVYGLLQTQGTNVIGILTSTKFDCLGITTTTDLRVVGATTVTTIQYSGSTGVTTIQSSTSASGTLTLPATSATLATQSTDIDYITPGTYTYTPGQVSTGSTTPSIPAQFSAKYYMIQMVGAGGGGSSGTCGVVANNIPGGAGGSGGSAAVYWIPGEFVDSMTIQVGTGGTGGASVIGAAAVAGVAGQAGAGTTITINNSLGASLVFFAPGGLGGQAPGLTGTSSVAGAANTTPLLILDGLFHISPRLSSGGAGGAGGGTGAAAGLGATSFLSASGGGGGGGNTTAGAANLGGNGGSKIIWDGSTITAVAAATSATAGQDASAVTGSTLLLMNGAGLGGAGGSASGTAPAATPAGRGGNGIRGGGGGGGGASKLNAASGAGGNGGDGYVRIIAFG